MVPSIIWDMVPSIIWKISLKKRIKLTCDIYIYIIIYLKLYSLTLHKPKYKILKADSSQASYCVFEWLH